MKAICLAILISLLVFTASSVAQDKLAETLAANRFDLKIENGKLSGTGAVFLSREAADSQFILVGEPHGIADVPEFVSALFTLIHTNGFDHIAVETGPLTAARMETLAATPNGFSGFILQYPFGLPFYNWTEESVFLQNAIRLNGNKKDTIWGIDQEFMASSAFHLQRLYDLAPNGSAKNVMRDYLDRAKTEFDRVVASRNPGEMFLASAKGEDFEKLDAAFRGSKNKEALQILKELRESTGIYSKIFTGRGYESNRQRSLLMKGHFMAYYNTAAKKETLPKVLFKFGSNHVKRGLNFTNVYDLGSLISELADTNGTKSLHILIIANGGTQNTFVPFAGSESDKAKKIDPVKANNFADIGPLLKLANENDKFVIDLRPLRPMIGSGQLKNLPDGFAGLVFGYDAVVLLPNVHAATNLPWTPHPK